MGIMAIRALNQSLVHAVMERHFELGLLLQMAGIAKLRLRFNEQKLLRLRMVNRVAGCAAHIILPVQRVHCVHVLGAASVAAEAAVIDFLGGMILENENLGDIPAACDVRAAGTVATLASLM
jgi:hypothetical protein